MGAATGAIAAYRDLLRATRKYFPGDKLRQAEMAVVIRKRFEENRGVTAEADVERLLDEAREASDFMWDMIEQLDLIPYGGYVVKPTKEHAGATLEIPSEDVHSKST